MQMSKKGRKMTFGFGVPHAPILMTPMKRVNSNFYKEKKDLIDAKLPIYTWKEVQRFRQDGSQQGPNDDISRRLHDHGYHKCAEEVKWILSKDKSINSRSHKGKYGVKIPLLRLVQRPSALKLLTDTLLSCEDLVKAGAIMEAVTLRKDVAITFIDMKDHWLSEYILQTCLQIMDEHKIDVSQHQHVLAEIHLLLAYVKGHSSRRGSVENSVDDRINHIIECRKLIGKGLWRMKSDVVKLTLEKPRSTGNFRQDTTIIDSRTSSMKRVAAVFEIILLIEKAFVLLYRPTEPSEETVNLAMWFAQEALRHSREISDDESLKIALIQSGIIATDSGHLIEAMDCYGSLLHLAHQRKDRRMKAISYQGIGECLRRKKDVLGAIDALLTSCQVGAAITDIRIEALFQIGIILLEEGMLVEAEECMRAAVGVLEADGSIDRSRDVRTLLSQWMQYIWVVLGVVKGETCWSRYGCLARRSVPEAIKAICEFKIRRVPLPVIPYKPDTSVTLIKDVFDASQLLQPIAIDVHCNTLKMGTKEFRFKVETPMKTGRSKGLLSSVQKQALLRRASKIMSEKSILFKEKLADSTTFCDLSSTTGSTTSSGGSQNIYDQEVLYQSDWGQVANLASVASSLTMSGFGVESTEMSLSASNESDSTKEKTTSSDSNSLERFSKKQLLFSRPNVGVTVLENQTMTGSGESI